jgi:hypothetical protein
MKAGPLVCVLAVAASLPAAAQEFPKLKPGLWEVSSRTSTQAKDDPPLKSSMCLDEASAREMYQASQGMMAGMCATFEVKRAGARYTSEAECKLGESTMVARSTMTLQGDTSYRIEGTSTFDPPFMGMKAASTSVEARHAGACKPGQKPGDITTAAGQTINIRQLQPPAK